MGRHKKLIPLFFILAVVFGCAHLGPASRPGDANEGLAAYCSDRLHGRATASGAPYDKNALTAAHRTLPFGTVVRVTNLVNRRSVQVTVIDTQVVLVTTSEPIAARTFSLIEGRIASAPRRLIIERALEGSLVLVAPTLDAAMAFSNAYAPEHLSIQTRSPDALTSSIRNAGSVFLGRWAPVTAGDYASGTNHTLPTSGRAVSQSGVSVESFCKTISFQSLSEQGLRNLAPTLRTLSAAEELYEHGRAVEVRFQ